MPVTRITEHAGPAGFSAVDSTADPASLVVALDEQAALPAVQRLRAGATELLDPRPGQRILDAGCGTGDVTRALAALVGGHGAVVGVDPSATMLAEARRRTVDPVRSVAFRLGDITALDAADGAFDGAYCERVFQHLTRPHLAMAELVRVTKPGARIVVVDTDWGMHAIHGGDPGLTARVIDCWVHAVPNGWSGRRLTKLFADVGIRDPTVRAETLIITCSRYATTEPISTMAEHAVHAGALTRTEAATWLAQLAAAGDAGHFLWAVTMFAVGGTRSTSGRR